MTSGAPFSRGLCAAMLLSAAVAGSSFLILPDASAATNVTLYVTTTGAGSTCSVAAPCATLAAAVAAALTDDGDADTIEVGAGTYTEHTVAIAATRLVSLTVQGAGAGATTIDGSASGGVLTLTGGTVTISGLSITHGTAHEGAGVDISGGTVNLETVTISTNTATTATNESSNAINQSGGGGIFVEDAALSLTGDQVVYDSAGAHGGGMFIGVGATVSVDDSIVSHDTAPNGGGGITNDRTSSLTMSDDLLFGDEAQNRPCGSHTTCGSGGGTINNRGSGSLDLSESIIRGSSTTRCHANTGGAIFNHTPSRSFTTTPGSLVLATDVISGCGVAFYGGAINNHGGTLDATNLTLTTDTSPSGGGGIYTTGGPAVTISDSVFESNTSGTGSSMDVVGTTSLLLTDDTFSSNTGTAVTLGGGTFTFKDDTFSSNVGGYGGAVYAGGANGAFTDDTFSTNRAISGGGVYDFGGAAMFTDDTFSKNVADLGGGIDNGSSSSSITATASIFFTSTCAGGVTDGGYDVESGGSCAFGRSSRNTSATIDLSLLAPNTSTGPETMAIGPTSSAFELVPASVCHTVPADERAEPRPGVAGQNCDAGAFEYQGASTETAICPASSVSCDATTSRPGRPLVVVTGHVRVVGSGGRGTVGVGTFRHDPFAPLKASTGDFFGLSLSSGSTFQSLVISVCDVGAGTALAWWSGTSWEAVAATSTTTGGDSCLSVTLGPHTTPSLATVARLSRSSRLLSAVFGLVR